MTISHVAACPGRRLRFWPRRWSAPPRYPSRPHHYPFRHIGPHPRRNLPHDRSAFVQRRRAKQNEAVYTCRQIAIEERAHHGQRVRPVGRGHQRDGIHRLKGRRMGFRREPVKCNGPACGALPLGGDGGAPLGAQVGNGLVTPIANAACNNDPVTHAAPLPS